MKTQTQILTAMVEALKASGVEIDLRISKLETGVVMTSTPNALDNIRAFLHASNEFNVQTDSKMGEYSAITFNTVNSFDMMQDRLLELCDEWGFGGIKESVISGKPSVDTAEQIAQGIFVGSLAAAEADPTSEYDVVTILTDANFRKFLVTNAFTLETDIPMEDVLAVLDTYIARLVSAKA